MIDTARLREMAPDGSGEVRVTGRWLRQVADEIEAGRKAKEELAAHDRLRGAVFGLRPGTKI